MTQQSRFGPKLSFWTPDDIYYYGTLWQRKAYVVTL